MALHGATGANSEALSKNYEADPPNPTCATADLERDDGPDVLDRTAQRGVP